jgi:hypothetical protein
VIRKVEAGIIAIAERRYKLNISFAKVGAGGVAACFSYAIAPVHVSVCIGARSIAANTICTVAGEGVFGGAAGDYRSPFEV